MSIPTTRLIPSLTQLPDDLSGNNFSLYLQNSILALWNVIGTPLTNIGGTANAITADIYTPTGFTGLVNGMKFSFTAGATNTDEVDITLNYVSGTIEKSIVNIDGDELPPGSIIEGRHYNLEYNSTADALILQSPILGPNTDLLVPRYTRYQLLTGTGTFNLPYRSYFEAHVIGATGSGARHSSGSSRAASAAGAGGHAIKRGFAETSVDFDYEAATGGAPTSNANGVAASGNSTLDFEIDSVEYNLIATPGAPGVIGGGGSLYAGGLGGNASGGDENWSGGDGGDAQGATSQYNHSGGGSVGIFSNGYKGGTRTGGSSGAAGASLAATPANNSLTSPAGFIGEYVVAGLLSLGEGLGDEANVNASGRGAGFFGYGGGAPGAIVTGDTTGSDGAIIIFYTEEVPV